jgi:hypothetical protein
LSLRIACVLSAYAAASWTSRTLNAASLITLSVGSKLCHQRWDQRVQVVPASAIRSRPPPADRISVSAPNTVNIGDLRGSLGGVMVAVAVADWAGGAAGSGVVVAGKRVAVDKAVAGGGRVAVSAGLVGIAEEDGVALGVAGAPKVKMGRGILVGTGDGVAKKLQPLTVTAVTSRVSTMKRFMRTPLHLAGQIGAVKSHCPPSGAE